MIHYAPVDDKYLFENERKRKIETTELTFDRNVVCR